MTVSRRHALLVGIAFLVAVVGAFSVAIFAFASMHAQLEMVHTNHVWLKEPVTIHFDQAIDPVHLQLAVSPKTPVATASAGKGEDVVIRPVAGWRVATTYTLVLGDVANARHTATLKGWRGAFSTQPDVAVAAFKASGQPVADQGPIRFRAPLAITFSVAMNPATVKLTLNGVPPIATTLAWSDGNKTISVARAHPLPSQAVQVAVTGGSSSQGDPLVAPAQVALTTLGLEPSNGSSGIGANFTTVPPLQVVVEDSGPSRPQSGLQQADVVYEYISEYNISRFTVMYFNNPPSLIGPVRSCRLINPPLNFAFHGFTMCSGASVGTLHYMFSLKVPSVINDFDNHGHFFRVNFMAAPHNVYTSAGKAPLAPQRASMLPTPPYTVDPPHPDNGLGTPAAPPAVPLHNVTYTYDPGSKTYLRIDHGTPFIDAGTKAQLHVKNVILINTPYQVRSYVEDESGGAHSVSYFLYNQDEQGSAQIYSDGTIINATWHMGWNWPMYFTDASGNFIELNTGLTWIHVIGNGQTS